VPRSRSNIAAIPRASHAEAAVAGRGGAQSIASLSIGLSAVIVAASVQEPRVLTIRLPASRASKVYADSVKGSSASPRAGLGQGGAVEALPSGPLEAGHRTLEIGLRAWVERQTGQRLGYVEQLYTFGDRDRAAGDGALALPPLTVAYLALVREAGSAEAEWQGWYRYFPWEDWRGGKPALLEPIEARLESWAATAAGEAERRLREERIGLGFGLHGAAWNEELVLERYELLYEAGIVAEAARDIGPRPIDARAVGAPPGAGAAMALDHRSIMAKAIGWLRGKIKYRPVVFELMPPAFTLLQLQRTVEALAGVRLHKQNFRRLVEQQGLVEETGEMSAATGGRPARLVRFRREVLLERPAPGLRLRPGRRAVPA
jgi:hypothetical protein